MPSRLGLTRTMDTRHKPREPIYGSAGLLDPAVTAAIIAALFGACIMAQAHIFRQAYAFEALTQARNFMVASQLEYAHSGDWPESRPGKGKPQFTELVDVDPGSAVFRFVGKAAPNRKHRFTINAAVNEQTPWGAVVWVCGNAEPPPGFQSISDNETTMASRDIPLSCRS